MGYRGIASIMGILAFSASVLAGLWIGNPPSVILLRSLWAMFAGALIGLGVGWAAGVVVRERLNERQAAMRASANEARNSDGESMDRKTSTASTAEPMGT